MSFCIPKWSYSPLLVYLLVLPTVASAAPRDVQIVAFDFETQVMELFNFGPTSEDLSGWVFCSASATQVRRYTTSAALDGVSLGSGESLFIHLLNDSGGQPETIDRPAGNWAGLPFESTAHGLELYFPPVNFANGNSIADHVQWSIDGAHSEVAAFRSDEAVMGGVWTDRLDWVATSADTTALMLKPSADGLILHGPDDYTALPEPSSSIQTAIALLSVAGLAQRRRKRRCGDSRLAGRY